MGADDGDGVLDGELEGSMAGFGVIHGDGPVSVVSLAAVVLGGCRDGMAKANKKMTTMAAISSADTGTSILLKWE